MAKSHYIGIGGVARKIKQPYIGISNVARKVKTGYAGIGGIARQFFTSGTPISTLSIGDTIYLSESGTRVPYIVVCKGNPDASRYDTSCDGIWLLRKYVLENRAWHVTQVNSYGYNDYDASDIHSYLNNTFINKFDASIKSFIKQVKIPYVNSAGTDAYTTIQGSNGLSTKIFLLSAIECGFPLEDSEGDDIYTPLDGSKLPYFIYGDKTAACNKRKATLSNGTANTWWTRSPRPHGVVYYTYYTNTDGRRAMYYTKSTYGIRPALILPIDATVDENYNVTT